MKVQNIDLSGLVLGRAASIIAQKLLDGYQVNAYNAEKLLVTGSIKDLFAKYYEKQSYQAKGDPTLGPKYPIMPHKIFKRTVRNMVPHQKPRGTQALKNLTVYIGNKSNAALETIEAAKLKSGIKYIELSELSNKLGARW